MTTATPFLMFQGQAQAALQLYMATFPDSRILHAEVYREGEPGPVGTIKVASFQICGRDFLCSDSPIKHQFTFTPSSSIFIDCESAEQLKQLFATLSEGGGVLMPLNNYGFSQQFGWVNDRFGVSWQLNLR